MVKEKIHNKKSSKESLEGIRNLILYNDDFNSFDFVIETLIKVCKHEPEQAEQCTLTVHFKGKCDIKSGTYKELIPICNEMTNRRLTVEIE